MDEEDIDETIVDAASIVNDAYERTLEKLLNLK